MVFLVQNAVVYPEPLVLPAAGSHRVFLREPQAGQGLARIKNTRARAGNGIHIAPRRRCHARQELQKIERAPLRAQQGARWTAQQAYRLASAHRYAFRKAPVDLDARIDLAHHCGKPRALCILCPEELNAPSDLARPYLQQARHGRCARAQPQMNATQAYRKPRKPTPEKIVGPSGFILKPVTRLLITW